MLRGPSLHPTAAERFLSEHGGIRSKKTAHYWGLILGALQERFPEKRVNEFTTQDLVDFIVIRDRQLAGSTQVTYRNILQSFFDWCDFRGLVDENPAKHLKRYVHPPVVPVRHHTWLSEAEIEKLLETGDGEIAHRDRVGLSIGLFSGLRVHEICGLTWKQVDLQRRTLSIVGKGGKAATQPFPPNLAEELFAWRGLAAENLGFHPTTQPVLVAAAYRIKDGVDGGRLLKWDCGLGGSGFGDLVRSHGDRIGVEKLAPHDLRRSYAGLLEARGVPLRTISQLMRHSNTATTERYLEGNPLRTASELDAAFSGFGG